MLARHYTLIENAWLACELLPLVLPLLLPVWFAEIGSVVLLPQELSYAPPGVRKASATLTALPTSSPAQSFPPCAWTTLDSTTP